MGVARALAIVLVLGAGSAAAQAAFELPWSDVEPAVANGAARAAAVAGPDERVARFSARRNGARAIAKRRATQALHRWADAALARVHADPQCAQAIHAAIERTAAVEGVRALADGGAVVVVTVPTAELRSACAAGALPWTR